MPTMERATASSANSVRRDVLNRRAAVDADHGEGYGEQREQREERRIESPGRREAVAHLREARDLPDGLLRISLMHGLADGTRHLQRFAVGGAEDHPHLVERALLSRGRIDLGTRRGVG